MKQKQQQSITWEYCTVDELYLVDNWDEGPERVVVRYIGNPMESQWRQLRDNVAEGFYNISDALEALGQVGWEMCGVLKQPMPNEQYRKVRYFFKRPIAPGTT